MPVDLKAYTELLRAKAPVVEDAGFNPQSPCPDWFKPHQRDAATWTANKGRAALFAAFGLGKTVIQLQWCKWVHEYTGGRTLIVAPLGVRQEFTRSDGPKLGMVVQYCRTDDEVAAAETPFIITNYERVRDGDIDVGQFEGLTLDEASCLRSYGTKTTQTFQDQCKIVPYRMVATATPAPNAKNSVDYLELINYAHFLGVMDRGLAMTRFFGRDSKTAGKLTLYPHMESQFWLWVASWALFISKPSDLGYSDEGYALPPLKTHWHKVETDLTRAHSECDRRGQFKLMPDISGDIKTASKERRATLEDRVAKAVEIVKSQPNKHWIIWHYLEDERHLIQRMLPESKSVYGSQPLDEREDLIVGFSNGDFQILSTKPEIAGSGCNFQRHCSDMVFVGPTDKFNDFIQAVHRVYRFLQTQQVNIHIVYADTQSETVNIMRRKWTEHDELTERMSGIVRRYGLNHEDLKMQLERSLGSNRLVVKGDNYTLVNNDSVVECNSIDSDSIDQIVTSIPFGDHYEYSPSYNDFGHNAGDEPFFEQMDYLIPNLYRILKPGRVACIHVKDRITYGKMTGTGMYGVNPFSDKTVSAFVKHGFHYMGRITIDTDVVRENAQTYRLGWTENSKDSTKMGCGSNEFVLLFRKWHPDMSPDNTANGPKPVTKEKVGDSAYSRAKWQIHASGTWRSSGDELLSPAQLQSMDHRQIMFWWKGYCERNGYDYQKHLQVTELMDEVGSVPSGWMLFPPHSNNPDVWTDILRIRTLNTNLSRKTSENHVCPLQLDVIERLIDRYSNPGDVVLDPFNGVGSTVFQSIKMGRKGYGIELSHDYWGHSVAFCEQAEAQMATPTLFDLMEAVA